MIGYEITASSGSIDIINHNETYRGYSEGDPNVKSDILKKASEDIVTNLLTSGAKFIGSNPNVLLKVVDIVSKPLTGIGEAFGKRLAELFMELNVNNQKKFLNLYDILVTLVGDFEGTYRINTTEDMDDLPKLLALIPSVDSTDKFMGEAVLKTAYIAHVNFLKDIGYRKPRKREEVIKLVLEIKL